MDILIQKYKFAPANYIIMRKNLLIVFALFAVTLLSSCDYYRDNFQYSAIAKHYMNALMQQDYDKSISYMQASTEHLSKGQLDTMKAGMAIFRTSIIKQFGEDKLDYSFMQVVKGHNSVMQDIPNTTTILLQFSNDKDLGVLQVLFSTKTDKMLNIKSLNIKQPIPDMSSFWLFGVLALCIPLFNIYMIIRVKRSDMTKKWVKYIAIAFFNFPAVGYAQIVGLFFKTDMFRQVFFGISLRIMGYPGSAWIFGIPLGALYILWQLKSGNYKKAEKKAVSDPHQVKGKRFKGK